MIPSHVLPLHAASSVALDEPLADAAQLAAAPAQVGFDPRRLQRLEQSLIPELNRRRVPLAEAAMATMEYLNSGDERALDEAFRLARQPNRRKAWPPFNETTPSLPELVNKALVDRGAEVRLVVGFRPDMRACFETFYSRNLESLPTGRRQLSPAPDGMNDAGQQSANLALIKAGIRELRPGQCMWLCMPCGEMFALGRNGHGPDDWLTVGRHAFSDDPTIVMKQGREAQDRVSMSFAFQGQGPNWGMVLPADPRR